MVDNFFQDHAIFVEIKTMKFLVLIFVAHMHSEGIMLRTLASHWNKEKFRCYEAKIEGIVFQSGITSNSLAILTPTEASVSVPLTAIAQYNWGNQRAT